MILAPPKPRLWLPSLADSVRWMSHLCKDPATKHLRKASSAPKHLVRTCGCRGCPDSFTLTSTLIASTGCLPATGTLPARRLDTSANGSWTLTRFGTNTTPCIWVANTPGILIGRYNAACAFLFDSLSPQWAMTTSDGVNFALSSTVVTGYTVFSALFADSGTCTTSLAFTNANSSTEVGTGGSVTVTP